MRKLVAAIFSLCLICACARAPRVTLETALDYGQFVLRETPGYVDIDALKGKRIVLDPGHGGPFSGAVGPNNLREADVNLGVALYLWGMLKQAGAEAYLTRFDDSAVYQGQDLTLKKDLQARAEFAAAKEADLFLSLHHNADVLPGQKKNSLETYFQMTDAGPSLDAARCIHRQLAVSLNQTDNAILPGNFHVLRESPLTAVLGEPSYISHSDNAFRLGLAPMQRVEARAYFLGIAEYFSKGVPKITDLNPRGTLNDNPLPLLTARLIPDRGVAIDPASIHIELDGKPVEAMFDAASSVVSYLPPARLTNGKHVIRIEARNVNGNSARPAEAEFALAMPPAVMSLSSNFEEIHPASNAAIRLTARVFDADLFPVADGTPVRFETSDGLFSAHALTVAGEAVTHFTLRGITGPEAVISATSDSITESIRIRISDTAPEVWTAYVIDSITGQPVENALVTVAGHPSGHTDQTGYFGTARHEVEGCLVKFSRRGYERLTIEASDSADTRLGEMTPVADGVLFGRKFAIDAQFGGHEKGVTGPTGIRSSDLNALTAEYLAQHLRGAGADVMLTRESDITLSALNRVELAESFGAQWFISIGHTGDSYPGASATASVAGVSHYPTSDEGKRLATAISDALASQGVIQSALVIPSTDYVLTHTSGVAVKVEFPGPLTPEMEERLRNPAAARDEAYAVYRGILAHFGWTN
ncbi:MAG: hypothetical protein Kow0099_06320 [Candidatus Abyssubacteria bacterium]